MTTRPCALYSRTCSLHHTIQAETEPAVNKGEDSAMSAGEVGQDKETDAAINIGQLYRDAMRIVSSSRMALAKVHRTAAWLDHERLAPCQALLSVPVTSSAQ